MLNTRSGRASATCCGKDGSASSRTTLPKRPRACSTAAMVDGSSHSANASLVLEGCAAEFAASGFWLYARPMRMWSRVTSYKKGRWCGPGIENALSVRQYDASARCAIGKDGFFPDVGPQTL